MRADGVICTKTKQNSTLICNTRKTEAALAKQRDVQNQPVWGVMAGPGAAAASRRRSPAKCVKRYCKVNNRDETFEWQWMHTALEDSSGAFEFGTTTRN
jgi:hypothetical protein